MITERRFAPLFWTQALGALNDNLLRTLLVLVLVFAALPDEPARQGLATSMVVGLFILPFLLFSAWGGALADRLDKQRLIRRLKLFELGIMLLAAALVWWESRLMLYGLLLLMGAQAALFGPVKYAILPQHLTPTELVRGNAWVGLGTFVSILIGTVLATLLAMLSPASARLAAVLALLGVAVAGLAASLLIPPAPPKGHDEAPRDLIGSIWPVITDALRARQLLPAMLGLSVFWFMTTCYLTLLPAWASQVAGGLGSAFTLLLAAFALGVGVGAMLCARLSAGRLELGLVVLGALLMGVGGLWLAGTAPLDLSNAGLGELLLTLGLWRMLSALALVGIGGGLYIVPLYSMIQLLSREQQRARMMAANNIFNALLMLAALLFGTLMLGVAEVGLAAFVASLGGIALLIGVGLLVRGPRPLLRLLIFALVHLIYRLKFRGRQHIPVRGAALVVCNHVSFMDALVIGGASPRPLRFLMDRPIYESPWLNWWFRIVGAIPVDADRRDPGSVRRALDEVSHALRHGEVVMLFPEGRLTPDGEIHRFRRGLDIILTRDSVPVVPAGLAGLWGSWTSHQGGRALTKWPRRFRSRVALYFGEPLSPQEARCGILEERVRELKAEADDWVLPAPAARGEA
ncbi:MFS transporter [Halomonas sp. ML-15]|nr:MFS transporter [Halomonas sp. ML-15]